MAQLRDNIVSGNTGHLADHNQIADEINLDHNIVTDYGAVGGDTGNQSTAIQAAIDAAGNAAASSGRGGDVVFPPGKYRLGATLTIPDGVRLRGIGKPGGSNPAYGAVLTCATNSMTMVQHNGVNGQVGFEIRDLVFSANAGTSGIIGLSVADTLYWRVDNCVFHSVDDVATPGMDTGIALNPTGATGVDTSWNAITRCTFRRNVNGIHAFGAPRVAQCAFIPSGNMSGGTGVWLDSNASMCSQGAQINQCSFVVQTNAYGVRNSGAKNSIQDCAFEGNTGSTGNTSVWLEWNAASVTPHGTRNRLVNCNFTKGDTHILIDSGCTKNGFVLTTHISVQISGHEYVNNGGSGNVSSLVNI